MTTRVRVVVEGLVQGVGFRETCRREAQGRGVAGWARNLADGRVEAVFEGPEEQVAAMVDWCRHGPPWAEVKAVTTGAEAPAGATGFAVR